MTPIIVSYAKYEHNMNSHMHSNSKLNVFDCMNTTCETNRHPMIDIIGMLIKHTNSLTSSIWEFKPDQKLLLKTSVSIYKIRRFHMHEISYKNWLQNVISILSWKIQY